jgi:hypothetical protein
MGGKRSTLYDHHEIKPAHTTRHSARGAQPGSADINQSSKLDCCQKLAILTEYESFVRGAPERGALLRRHGIVHLAYLQMARPA